MRPVIAIIDSDATTRRMLCRLLEALDVEIATFETAESYLMQSANSQPLACLIADVSLPGMSGIALLQRIRETDRDLPVVLLATEAEVPIAVEAMRHGATDFIEMPRLDVALLRRVSQVLRNSAVSSAAS